MRNTLSYLAKPTGATSKPLRKGRGVGSGLGKTAGRGQKGQYARTGGFKPHFEGGQTPLQRRLPKRGFNPHKRETVLIVSTSDFGRFEAGAVVNLEILAELGIVRSRIGKLKVLGGTALGKALTVTADAFSKTAAEEIRKAGGQALIREGRV